MTTPRQFTLLLMVAFAVRPGWPRPQALKVSSEIGFQGVHDRRWDDDGSQDLDYISNQRYEERDLIEISRSFRQSASLNRALMEVLAGLTEKELRVLERALIEEDQPQADMPIEDLVEDSPQELPGEDVAGVEDMAGYRGELLVLDGVNSSAVYNATEPLEEPVFPQLQKINREKLKEMRLATIKNQIMNILWPVGTPPSLSGNNSAPHPPGRDLLRAIADKMRTQKNAFTPGDVYTEKIQSFYPSCELPRNTDAELWSENEVMNLLFDLSYPTTVQGTQVNIVAAKLRLYKLSQGNASMSSEICPPQSSEPEESPSEEGSARQQISASPSFGEDKMIRVSIYWYTRSLKKHRVKRKLLDSQMLSVYGESWTEWNIRGAVKAWRDNGRNFGLAVEVEDEDGALLPTERYFAPMNCSQEASTSRPIPGFLVARAFPSAGSANSTNHTFGKTLHFDTFLFPMIDLCTIEFPESEKPDAIYYHKVSEHSENNIKRNDPKESNKGHNSTAETSNTPLNSVSDSEKHRIRHQNHKHGDEKHDTPPHTHIETVRRDDGDSIEEITWADDLEGHQLRKQIIVQKVIMKSQNNQEDNER